jgi:hypothetical protein
MVAGRDKVADTGSRYLGRRTRDETGVNRSNSCF